MFERPSDNFWGIFGTLGKVVDNRVRKGPEKPGKSWNFILEKATGPGKSCKFVKLN